MVIADDDCSEPYAYVLTTYSMRQYKVNATHIRDVRFSLMTHVMTLELYYLIWWRDKDAAASVVPGRAVTVNSGGGVDCTVKWAKTLYYGEIVGSGKLTYLPRTNRSIFNDYH